MSPNPLLPETHRPSKPRLCQTAPIPVQCLPLPQPPPTWGNYSVSGRLTARPPQPVVRTKRGRTTGRRPTRRWRPAPRWTIRQKTTTAAKTTAPCLRLLPAPGRLASGSQRTGKSCGAWSKTLLRPRSCGSSRGGWSRWWRRRSRDGGGGGEAAPEAELLQRRRSRRKASTRRAKTTRRRAPTAKAKRLLPDLPRISTRLLVRPSTRRPSGATLRILHHICFRTCPC